MEYDQSILWKMSFLELIGAIFVRSQLIEQIMRQLILAKEGYKIPVDFETKTYGGLLTEFAKLYPELKENKIPPEYQKQIDMSLYSSLKDAKEVRDSAAHGDYLESITIKNLMPGQEDESINRYVLKGVRKSALVMDTTLIELWNFRTEVLKKDKR